MLRLTAEQAATLRDWFAPERPGPLVGLHLLNTGHGSCHVDRWPAPRAALVETAGNYSLAGDPAALDPEALRPLITGFVDAPAGWEPVLRAAFPELALWDRVIFALPPLPRMVFANDAPVRRLEAADATHIAALSPDSSWIANTWGGANGLATSGMAWGAFVEDKLAAIACSFYVGDHFEDIGVTTEEGFRGRGLSVACAGSLCNDIHRRGRTPSWTTSPDNKASIRVAEKLGFVYQRSDLLYVIGIEIPQSSVEGSQET